jgi:hypothetical protein
MDLYCIYFLNFLLNPERLSRLGPESQIAPGMGTALELNVPESLSIVYPPGKMQIDCQRRGIFVFWRETNIFKLSGSSF